MLKCVPGWAEGSDDFVLFFGAALMTLWSAFMSVAVADSTASPQRNDRSPAAAPYPGCPSRGHAVSIATAEPYSRGPQC